MSAKTNFMVLVVLEDVTTVFRLENKPSLRLTQWAQMIVELPVEEALWDEFPIRVTKDRFALFTPDAWEVTTDEAALDWIKTTVEQQEQKRKEEQRKLDGERQFETKLRHTLLELGLAYAAGQKAPALIDNCVSSIYKADKLKEVAALLLTVQGSSASNSKILYKVEVKEDAVELQGCSGSFLPQVRAAARGYAELYKRPARFVFNDIPYEVVAEEDGIRVIGE